MNARLEQARRKAAEMGQQAKEAAARARAQAAQERRAAQAPPAAGAGPTAAAALVCPECNGAIAFDDVVCGACARRLK